MGFSNLSTIKLQTRFIQLCQINIISEAAAMKALPHLKPFCAGTSDNVKSFFLRLHDKLEEAVFLSPLIQL